MEYDFTGDRISFAERANIDLKFQATYEALGALTDVVRMLDEQNTALNKRFTTQAAMITQDGEYIEQLERKVESLETQILDLQVRLSDLETDSYR